MSVGASPSSRTADRPLSDVARYFASTLDAFGATPRGVDWNGDSAQQLRFDQLLRVVDVQGHFSINDLGCGYGALLEHLDSRDFDVDYLGIDLCAQMVDVATERHRGRPHAAFVCGTSPPREADYGVASGIFNMRLGRSRWQWTAYIEDTLDQLNATSRRGFSFNCLTSYSDPPKMRDDLYYADPCAVFDLCRRRYSKNVALLHDYGLYDFTILVTKER